MLKYVILAIEDGDDDQLYSENKNEEMNYLTEIRLIFNALIFEDAKKVNKYIKCHKNIWKQILLRGKIYNEKMRHHFLNYTKVSQISNVLCIFVLLSMLQYPLG